MLESRSPSSSECRREGLGGQCPEAAPLPGVTRASPISAAVKPAKLDPCVTLPYPAEMPAVLRKCVGVLSAAIYVAAAALGHALHDHGRCGADSGVAICEEQVCGCELHQLLDQQRPSESSEGVTAGSSCGAKCLACQLMAVLQAGQLAEFKPAIEQAASLDAVAIAQSRAPTASFAVPSPRGPPARPACV